MPTLLQQISFDASLLPLVQDFDCSEVVGSTTLWEDEINQGFACRRRQKTERCISLAEARRSGCTPT
jgi:hypothetical protein